MQTKPKSNSVVTHTVAGNVITFHVLGVGDITFDTALVHTAVAERAAVHGFIQRISDAAAISRDPKTGKSATPDEKHDAMLELVNHYQSGSPEWSRVGQAGPRGGILFRALVRIYDGKQSPEQIRTFLDGINKTEQAALRAEPSIAAVIREIEADDASQSKVDTDALLAQLS